MVYSLIQAHSLQFWGVLYLTRTNFKTHHKGLVEKPMFRIYFDCHSGEGRNPVLLFNKLGLVPGLRRGDISVDLLRRRTFSTGPKGQTTRETRRAGDRFDTSPLVYARGDEE